MDKYVVLVLASDKGKYVPNIPKEFSTQIDFNDSCGCYANLLYMRHKGGNKIELWFKDEKGDTFSYTLEEIKETHPMLYASIVTHLHDIKGSVMV